MNRILRSILPDPRVGDNEQAMLKNYLDLRSSILKFELKEDKEIYEYVRNFIGSYSHLPTQQTAIEYFDSNNKFDEADRIRGIASLEPAYRGDFIFLIEKQVEENRMMRLSEIISESKEIARTGLEIKEGRNKYTLKGARDAGKHLINKTADLLTPTFGTSIGGEALTDGDDFWEEYRKAEEATKELYPLSGFEVIDNALGGFKKKELYIVAGFTGHMKSKTTMNWVYNQAIYGGMSTVYFSLEMHYTQCRYILYAFHTMHHKFREKRLALGIQKQQNPDVGIDPVKIREARLSPDEKAFLKEVIDDLKEGVENGTYGEIHFEVADPDSLDFTVEDLRAKAETLAQQKLIHTLAVDHAGLMSSRSRYSSTTEKLNEVIRDLKKLAMGFNRGQGIPILCLFQINREGFKAAEKNNGNYNLTHLSYANEAERSADVVVTTWYNDEMREKGMIQYQCLKSRDQAPFETFEAQTAWPVGRILNVAPNFVMGNAGSKAKKPSADPLDDVV